MTPDQLHTHAVQAEKHVEQLATGLGQAGAPDQVIKSISQMADGLRELAKQLGKAAPPPKPKRPTMDEAAAGMQQDMQASRAPAPENQ